MNPMLFRRDLTYAGRAHGNAQIAHNLLRRLEPRILQVVHMPAFKEFEADELFQICLIEVYRSLLNYRGEGSLESWAGQLSYRVIQREIRKQKRISQKRNWEGNQKRSFAESPEKAVIRHEFWRQLSGQLRTMPPKRRAVLIMHLIHDYTVSEVARRNRITINTVKYHLKIAYSELREMMSTRPELYEAMSEQ